MGIAKNDFRHFKKIVVSPSRGPEFKLQIVLPNGNTNALKRWRVLFQQW